MAFTKTTRHSAKVRGDYLIICVEITDIMDGDTGISRNKKDVPYYPDSDWSSEAANIKTICDIHFTETIKTAWAALSDAEKSKYK